jgi:hypothetical protein
MFGDDAPHPLLALLTGGSAPTSSAPSTAEHDAVTEIDTTAEKGAPGQQS